MEQIGIGLKGIYRDRLLRSDGQIVYDSGWVSNTIVDSCRLLLATFMCSGFITSPSVKGIVGLAVGAGDASWDQQLPQPVTTTLKLVNEYKPPVDKLQIAYYTGQSASPTPTSQLEITATLVPGYPKAEPVPLREFGLYGALDGVPYLINYVIHRVIYKAETDTLVRVIRLSF